MANSGFKSGMIKLDSPNSTYYSGQVIFGSVVFNLNAPLTFAALSVEVYGEAKVLWTEEQTEEYNGVRSHGMVKYHGHEEYLRFTQCLAGGTGVSQLPEGPQEFKFSCQIPHTAPSSFEGEAGSVTYRVTAFMQYPEPTRPNEDIVTIFQVVAPLDLNFGSPAIKQPVDLEFEEVYGCDCICSSSPVTIRVRLPVTGYCSGQTIPISIDAQNNSSVEISKMIFQLTTKECYRSNQPIAEHMPPEKVLATVKKGPVMGNSKRNFTCEMVVPDMIVPYLENCGIIEKGYFFRTTIKLSGCNDDLQDESEICLGLVPLKELVQGEYVHPMAHSLPQGPIPTPGDPILAPGYVEPSNTPYSTQTQFEPTMNKKPHNDYEIGFKVPNVQQPYPMANPMALPQNNTPYPGNIAPQGYPYPGNRMQAPGNPGATPSAPPAYP